MEESVSLTSLSLNHCVRACSALIGVETVPGTKAMGLPATEHSKVSAEASPMCCPCILRSPYVVLIPCNNLTGHQWMYLRATRPAHRNTAKLWCPEGLLGACCDLGDANIFLSEAEFRGDMLLPFLAIVFFFKFPFENLFPVRMNWLEFICAWEGRWISY